jgi:ABC-type glutathione transport system ATPase component
MTEPPVPLPEPLLEVENLSLAAGTELLVRDLSFSVHAGEALGLVGESGSGKTLTLRGIIGLLPANIRRIGGTIRRGGSCAMVFQDPLDALDPLMPAGSQLAEVVYYRQGTDKKTARARALELLELVRIPEPERRFYHYPHQFSGGQRQRIVIALALATQPRVLLCDEPTTALDVTVQKQILEVIDTLRKTLGLAVVLVSHDLALVGSLCSRICVMSRGRVLERGESSLILGAPRHPYTRSLLDAVQPKPAPGEGAFP